MKKIIIALLLFIPILAKTQVTLEHTYQNQNFTTLELVDLGKNSYKYIGIDRANWTFSIYNLNHSLLLSDTFPHAFLPYNNSAIVTHFSNSVFDCDSSNIEYLVHYRNCPSQPTICNYFFTRVYRTDRTLLFSADSCSFTNLINSAGVYSPPISNSPNGAKMILYCGFPGNSNIKVYGVCDSVPINNIVRRTIEKNGVSLAYPNPAKEYTKVSYSLPSGVNSGEILIYDINGNQIKTYKVDNTFNELILSTSDLASGSYYYQLKTSQGLTGGKKFIKIN